MATATLVLRVFPEAVKGIDDEWYDPRICGRSLRGERWEGWIEFTSRATGSVLRSTRETSQPNLRNLEWWAQGLSRIYMEGALQRALERERPRMPGAGRGPTGREEEAHYPGPAPSLKSVRDPAPDDAPVNPALLYGRGEATLRRTLEALPRSELVTVIRAYRMARVPGIDVESLSRKALIELIVSTVEARAEDREVR